MTTPTLRAERLVKRFGDFVAVDAISFEVHAGEVVGLLGANGAGKTTTIRMLVGLLAPTSGTAHLLGGPPDRASRARLGYVPQGLGLYRDLTVRENLDFVAAGFDYPPAAVTGPLADVGDRRVDDISLGLQRQLAFACALRHRPDVLVLDEPTSGVGPLASANLWDDIRSAAEAGAGVLVSTHSMLEARQCDRLILMADGAVAGSGSEADIVGKIRAVEVSTARWREAFKALSASGSVVTLAGRSVRVVERSADEVRSMVAGIDDSAEVVSVPATIDERMAFLASS